MNEPTLLHAVRRHAKSDLSAVIFLDGEGRATSITRRELDRRARAVAVALSKTHAPGSRVLILCAPGIPFITAFLGCLYGGFVAIPAFPPDPSRLAQTLPRLQAIAQDAGTRSVLMAGRVRPLAELVSVLAPDLADLEWNDVEALELGEADAWRPPGISPDTVAFLQYTSGSTGEPKGVRLTHRNLVSNARNIEAIRGGGIPPIGVSWLPPYHDMGLIGTILQPLWGGGLSVQMSPETFLRSPLRWLRALETYGATCSPIPNFGLDLCVRRTTPEQRASLDLSALTCLIVGAEPIRPASLDRFADAFAPAGFRPEYVHPAYGLAEATLVVSGLKGDQPPTRWQGRVSCGRPMSPVRIVHPLRHEPLPDGQIGEIWIRGDHVADAYHGRPEASKRAFGSELDGQHWLRSGDLGAIRDGELFITGRIKDLIVRRGRNLHPHDLEATAARAHAFVRPGGVAAFSVDDGERERLVLLTELDPTRAPGVEDDLEGACRAIRDAVASEHLVPPDQIVALAPRTLLKTSSGKLRRAACREAWLAGELPVLHESLGTPAGPEHERLVPEAEVYPSLDETASELDCRPTRYQFDLEQDIPWERMGEPGDFIPPGLVHIGWAEAGPLREDPVAWEVFQWSVTLALCDVIIKLEEGLLDFVRAHHASVHGERRSIQLLDEEETKHIALFRRVGDALRARHPELLDVYDAALARHWVEIPVLGDEGGDSPAEHHYRAWLQVVFFEEWTLWFHEQLHADKDAVHPVWLAAHRAHAREEVQHVRTDAAWLDAMALSQAQKRALSRRLVGEVMRPMQVSNHVMREVCSHRFPDQSAQLARPDSSAPLLSILRDRRLSETRRHAPFFAELASSSLPVDGPPARVRRVPSEAEAQIWLTDWISDYQSVDQVDLDSTFAELGLDSADALLLAGELEDWVGGRLQPTLPYELPTPRLLAGYLAALGKQTRRVRRRPRVKDVVPASSRQSRWLDLALAQGTLVHNVTEIYEISGPVHTARLEGALRSVVAANPQLRSRFEQKQEQWVVTRDPRCAEETVLDEVHAGPDFESILQAVARRTYHRAFAPTDHPLLSATLVRGEDRAALVLGAPHVGADGVSTTVLIRQLLQAYEMPGLVLPVRDPALLVESHPPTPSDLDWWRHTLDGLPERPAAGPFAGRRIGRELPSARVEAWLARAESLGVTPFIYLLSALHIAWRQVRGSEPVFGTQLANRTTSGRAEAFGYLVDVAVVRARLDEEPDLSTDAKRVERAWLEAVQHRVSVADLVAELFPERLAERWLPAPASFNLMPPSQARWQVGESTWQRAIHWLPSTRHFLFYDEMLLAQRLDGGGMRLVHWYDSHTLDEEAATALLDRFVAVLEEDA